MNEPSHLWKEETGMTDNIDKSELLNTALYMLEELSKIPLLVDHFTETMIFEDFLLNLNMYLVEQETVLERLSKNKLE